MWAVSGYDVGPVQVRMCSSTYIAVVLFLSVAARSLLACRSQVQPADVMLFYSANWRSSFDNGCDIALRKHAQPRSSICLAGAVEALGNAMLVLHAIGV